MATNVKIRRSAVPGKIPTVGNITLGELALNTYDGKLFIKKDDGVEKVVGIEFGLENRVETGFSSPPDTIATYNSVARTITLSGTGTLFHLGETILDVSVGHTSAPHPDTAGGWFYSHNGTNYEWSMAPWSLNESAMIAYVNYRTAKFGIREVHGLMPWEAHREFHETVGTYRRSGGDVTVITGSSTTADKQPTIGQTVVADEDLPTILAPIATGGNYTHFYITGAGTQTFSTGNPHISTVSGDGRIQYNQDVAGTWQLTSVNVAQNYHVVFMIGIPVTADGESQQYRYVFIQGQEVHNNVTSARNYSFERMNLGDFSNLAPEFVVLHKFIIQTSNLNNGWYVEEHNKINLTRSQAQVTISSGGGITVHSGLDGRSDPDQHPIGAITNLSSELSGKEPSFTIQNISATAANSFSLGNIGFVSSVGTITLTNASSEATAKNMLFMATETIVGGAAGNFALNGLVTVPAHGYTIGSPLFLAETGGNITTTQPVTIGSIVRVIGYSLNTNTIYFNPDATYIEL